MASLRSAATQSAAVRLAVAASEAKFNLAVAKDAKIGVVGVATSVVFDNGVTLTDATSACRLILEQSGAAGSGASGLISTCYDIAVDQWLEWEANELACQCSVWCEEMKIK